MNILLILGYAACVALYLALTLSPRLRAHSSLWCLVIVLHLLLIGQDIFGAFPLLRMGFGQMLSLALCFSVIIFTVEARRYPIKNLALLHFPLAAIAAGLPCFFKGFLIHTQAHGFWPHWFLGIAIFTVFILATLYAIFILLQEKALHRTSHHRLQGLIRQLPALLVFEKLLHHMIVIGFVLLCAGLLSGGWMQYTLGLNHWWTHKNIFMCVAFIWFGGLLLGASRSAWRGKVLCYGTLIGFAFLFLGYVGSRFVLEVLLKRQMS